MAYIDGNAAPSIVKHLRRCATCFAEVAAYARVQRRLGRTFYRMGCPAAETLGDYEQGLVDGAERVAVAQHVLGCLRCTAELQTLRTFLASTPDRPESNGGLLGGLRRVLAIPLAARLEPSYELRGGRYSTTRSYRGGMITIEISQAPETRRGRFAVTGLVWHTDDPQADLSGVAELIALDGTTEETPIDASRTFAFEYVAEGAYQLALRLPHEIVVVEDLRVGSQAD
jgi:hypothetical protein